MRFKCGSLPPHSEKLDVF